MTSRHELDAVDRKILRILGTDGRASYQAIADEVGLSRPAVMERVKRLEESGHIAGYHARVDRARAGFPVTAFVAVRYANSDYIGDEPRMRDLEKHPAGPARAFREDADEHAHHDRARHRIRKAGVRPGGARLTWRPCAARR